MLDIGALLCYNDAMGLVQSITEGFEDVFNKNSPEVQKRLLHRKMEAAISGFTPLLYKDGVVLPNFGEAMRILYINTAPIRDILTKTIASGEAARSQRYEAQLVVTGFSAASQKLLMEISYDNRRADFDNTSFTSSQIFDKQRRKLDKIMNDLSGKQFKKIDEALGTIRQLSEVCKFNYLTILQVFDPAFRGSDVDYRPTYRDVEIGSLESVLEDFYYVSKGLVIQNSTLNAIIALHDLYEGRPTSPDERGELTKNVKQIAYIINHVLTAEKLKRMIAFCKEDEKFNPKETTFPVTAKDDFEKIIQARFQADEQRMKTQMNDEYISGEVQKLFGDIPLLSLQGYNESINNDLLRTGLSSFLWILPMEVLKTFIDMFFTENIRVLLNNVIIEGFFANPSYKTEFSTDVYAALNVGNALAEFEKSFADGQPNSVNVIENYVNEGHGNPDFMRRLDAMVKAINSQANEILTTEANTLNKVYHHIVDLIQDVKKPSSEIISNLKVLLLSSRNKENTDTLERQYPKWEVFFKIMRNYVILNA